MAPAHSNNHSLFIARHTFVQAKPLPVVVQAGFFWLSLAVLKRQQHPQRIAMIAMTTEQLDSK